MSKRFTKIICTAVAAISAVSMAFLPACKSSWGGVSGDKDQSTAVSSNGGFLVETGGDSDGYVYFINGTTANSDPNSFGSVLKGSVQRLKKSEMAKNNYANTQTVVPSVIYSGNHDAGIYVYGGYIYYTTPSADRDSDGNVLNDRLEFRRTKLDGTDTSGALWVSGDNAVDYRFVEQGGTVYILYALSENLYGASATNIHSVNCSTGKNTLLAYNVSAYSFDTEDATNPYVYYTMNVPVLNSDGVTYPFSSYNQLYMVRADAAVSPREYDLSEVDGYSATDNPVYVNYGKLVFDGIGRGNYNDWLTQFNFDAEKTREVNAPDRTFTIKWYKNGVLYFTRGTDDSNVSFYSLTVDEIDGDKDGAVDTSWDALAQSWADNALVSSNVSTEYTFKTLGTELYAINASGSGVTRSLVKDRKIGDPVYITNDSASDILEVREETDLGHTYLYYSVTGGNGYTVNRVAIDGEPDDYGKMPTDENDLTFETVKILDLDACSDWYKPEFVGNRLFFASEIGGMTELNYIMVFDLSNSEGKVMSNGEIKALNEKFEDVTDKINGYDDEENADGSAAYEHLSSALKYLYNTGDVDYIDELIDAYVKVEGRDKEYVYSEKSVEIYKDFAAAEGDDWADYKSAENTKTVNGKEVHANMRGYYYSVVGRMTDKDSKALTDYYKDEYMESYPTVEYKTWWQKLSTGGKVGAVFGIVEGCMLVIGGAVTLTAWLVTRKKAGKGGSDKAFKVDLTDDKDMDVYGDGTEENGGENA
ncbi:MAG: hypothetical protein NC131_02585 [Roseburia sp.]|nr:hypothetical protein [Roseburia sp.]